MFRNTRFICRAYRNRLDHKDYTERSNWQDEKRNSVLQPTSQLQPVKSSSIPLQSIKRLTIKNNLETRCVDRKCVATLRTTTILNSTHSQHFSTSTPSFCDDRSMSQKYFDENLLSDHTVEQIFNDDLSQIFLNHMANEDFCDANSAISASTSQFHRAVMDTALTGVNLVHSEDDCPASDATEREFENLTSGMHRSSCLCSCDNNGRLISCSDVQRLRAKRTPKVMFSLSEDRILARSLDDRSAIPALPLSPCVFPASASLVMHGQPTTETHRVSVSDADGYTQLNQYRLKEEIGKVSQLTLICS